MVADAGYDKLDDDGYSIFDEIGQSIMDGEECDPCDCSPENRIGACCVPGIDFSQLGGQFGQIGIGQAPALTPSAAFPCIQTTKVNCRDLGGDFKGIGVPCTPGLCDQPPPSCCESCEVFCLSGMIHVDIESRAKFYYHDKYTKIGTTPCLSPAPNGSATFVLGNCGFQCDQIPSGSCFVVFYSIYAILARASFSCSFVSCAANGFGGLTAKYRGTAAVQYTPNLSAGGIICGNTSTINITCEVSLTCYASYQGGGPRSFVTMQFLNPGPPSSVAGAVINALGIVGSDLGAEAIDSNFGCTASGFSSSFLSQCSADNFTADFPTVNQGSPFSCNPCYSREVAEAKMFERTGSVGLAGVYC